MELRRILFIVAIAFLGSLTGVLIGRVSLVAVWAPKETELHHLLHDTLDLDAAQEAQIAEAEQSFALRRKALELELRANNAKLAEAIEAEHGNGPLVEAAVDGSHHVMGELQKETLSHIFAMRQVLRPGQAVKFDRVVVRALTEERR
ncbi:periplasmic heavy metal sensor [Sphingobium yanoikuyae]|uniref:Periplasmic heavy metal sensor n=1 Tax=Sphingobium yanoikuyae TaxID=13690 RepID=A0A9X7UG74_SPHYA|nr:periplasmic heavy metal sensor [Sphingobium yanoikuyae]MDH2135189.1 periplasmic heavy metal sensor [Sphingobium yanoikuyae]MDH2170527.1 periplasmic heavy metal sensor [Sphingobium yanoikuyae]QNG49723.1 periplasmic heavy metal sensor [Sphingobium yanoikuyae]